MSERFAAASGRNVVSRASAEEIGTLAHIVVDVKQRTVASLVVGKGRKAGLVAWEHVSGFGPDAVMIADESALQAPRDDREHDATTGKLDVVGKRALSDMGNDLGTVTDVVFAPETGAIESIVIGDREEPASSLLGAGSFAVILRESTRSATPAGD
ncbi:MAG: PRC-barrel domain-containing protein [Solirubrobacteraceae bacterium]